LFQHVFTVNLRFFAVSKSTPRRFFVENEVFQWECFPRVFEMLNGGWTKEVRVEGCQLLSFVPQCSPYGNTLAEAILLDAAMMIEQYTRPR
jgi:hypothetical protein